MSKKNKEIVSDNKFNSYTVTLYGTNNKHLNIYKDACNKFLTDSLENILLFIKK